MLVFGRLYEYVPKHVFSLAATGLGTCRIEERDITWISRVSVRCLRSGYTRTFNSVVRLANGVAQTKAAPELNLSTVATLRLISFPRTSFSLPSGFALVTGGDWVGANEN